MSDLISRKELISELEIKKVGSNSVKEIIFFDAVMAIVDNQPTAMSNIDASIKQILQNQLVILGYLCNQSICEMSRLEPTNDYRDTLMQSNHKIADAYRETKKILGGGL